MNKTSPTSLAPLVPLASFGLAALLTLAMLAGVDGLATPDAAAPQMAQGAASAPTSGNSAS